KVSNIPGRFPPLSPQPDFSRGDLWRATLKRLALFLHKTVKLAHQPLVPILTLRTHRPISSWWLIPLEFLVLEDSLEVALYCRLANLKVVGGGLPEMTGTRTGRPHRLCWACHLL